MSRTDRIHIHHVLLSLQPGGLENGVVNVVNGLDPKQFVSSVCCLRSAGEFASRILRPEAKVHEMRSAGGIDWRLPFRLASLFSQTRTTIVHTRNAEAFFYGFLGAKLARVPAIVHSEHGRTFNDREIRHRVQRLFARHTNTIFSVSTKLKRDLVDFVGLDPTGIQVLHNGVDLDRFDQINQIESSSTRNSLGLSPSEIIVGSVGRLVTVKNYEILIRALAQIDSSKTTLMLVGDGPERNKLEALATAHHLGNRVRFMGHRNDIAELLHVMDIFVLPSHSEGMSNTLLEAMASRIPVIASDVGGNPEIIRDGIDGVLFSSNDVDALATRLRALIDSPILRIELAHSARCRVEEEFSISAMIARYEKMYLSCSNSVTT